MQTPSHLPGDNISSKINHEKNAVKTGIKLLNTVVLATPIFRTMPEKSTNASTDANTDNISNAPIAFGVIIVDEIVAKSVMKNVGVKNNKPIAL